MSTVRIVTLNFWGDHDPFEDRLATAVHHLAPLDPDVLLLQEVRQGEGIPNPAERLAARLDRGHQVVYRCAVRGEAGTWGPGSTTGEEGLAVLSRPAVLEADAVELPEARPLDRRILLSTRLDVGGAPLWVHTTHLHWRPRDGLAREKQVLAIDDHLARLGSDVPHVVGGDFNAPPDSDEIRFLTGRHTLAGRRTYYQDAFARLNPTAPGFTWCGDNPYIRELSPLEPFRRLDYLFVSPERNGRAQILSCRVVLDTPGPNGAWPSDHFGLLAEIRVG